MASSENNHVSPDEKGKPSYEDVDRRVSVVASTGEIVNASGHRDQLKRHYNVLSICGLALTIDNAWVALGGSIAVSISTISTFSFTLLEPLRDRHWILRAPLLATALSKPNQLISI